MKKMRLGFAALALILVLSGRAWADDEARKNAESFVQGLKGINESILGEHKYSLKMQGMELATMTITVKKASYEGVDPCYHIRFDNQLKVPGQEQWLKSESYVSPNLKVLGGQGEEKGDEGLKKTVLKLEKDTYTATITRDEETKTRTHAHAANLIHHGSNLLAILLLPKTTDKHYEFAEWDEKFDDELPQEKVITYSCGAVSKVKVGGVDFDAVEITESSVQPESEPEVVRIVRQDQGPILQVFFPGAPSPFQLITGKEEGEPAATGSKAEGFDTAKKAVVSYFHALANKDRDLLQRALDVDAVMTKQLRKEPQFANLSDEELRALAALSREEALKGMLSEEMPEEARFGLKMINEELLETEDVEAGKTVTVRFVDAMRQQSPDLASLEFLVAKGEKGWQIIGVEGSGGSAPEEELTEEELKELEKELEKETPEEPPADQFEE